MSLQNSQINARMIFQNALQVIKDANLTLDVTKCTISTLRLEQQIVTTRTSYQFPVLSNNNGPAGTLFNTEIRLNQQDSFVCAIWGFFLAAPASLIDTTFQLHTYPSPLTFTAGSAAAAETLYNSIIQISISNTIVLPVLSTARFRAVPQSQQVAAAANQNGIAYDQIDTSSDGQIPVEPNVLFIGSKNTLINLTLPAALAAVMAFQRGVMLFSGVLAQNSTIIT
jgi:hypothetical protein